MFASVNIHQDDPFSRGQFADIFKPTFGREKISDRQLKHVCGRMFACHMSRPEFSFIYIFYSRKAWVQYQFFNHSPPPRRITTIVIGDRYVKQQCVGDKGGDKRFSQKKQHHKVVGI